VRALALVLAGCFGGRLGPEATVYDASCTVFATCGATGDGVVIPVTGTPAEVGEIARGWVDACAAVTHEWVTSERCPFVWCGALCYGEDDGQ